jgi:Domain of unknown function (DUF4249)
MKTSLFVCFLLLLMACERELFLNKNEFEKKLVLNAYIEKDSMISGNISSTVSLLESPDAKRINDKMQFKLFRDGLLLYNDERVVTDGNFTLPYKAKGGSIYEIHVAYLDYNHIQAIDSVPISTVNVSIDTIIDQGTQWKLKFSFLDPIAPNKYLLQLESSGKQLILTDSVTSILPVSFTSNDKIFITNIKTVSLDNSYSIFDDLLINGKQNKIEISIDKSQFTDLQFTPKIIQLRLKCISETMFSYYKSVLESTHIYGGPLATHNPAQSNVNQGLGVFSFYASSLSTKGLP